MPTISRSGVSQRSPWKYVFTFKFVITHQQQKQARYNFNDGPSIPDLIYILHIVTHMSIARQRFITIEGIHCWVANQETRILKEKCFLCGSRRYFFFFCNCMVTRLYNKRGIEVFCAARSVP
jgi:hypothetical protein